MYKKLLISFFILLIVSVSSVHVVDQVSSNQLNKAFTRAVSVFAIARGLNGLISVVQGTEVYATPAGVGVNFALGQIVDPMNDMVERFSWIMLMSSISLGIQEIVLSLGQTPMVQAVLATSALFLLFILWIPGLWHAKSFNVVSKFLLIFLFLRFAVPLVVTLNEAVYTYALEPRYNEAKAALIFSSDEIKCIVSEVQVNQQKQVTMAKHKEESLIEKAQNYIDDTLESLDITKQLQNLSSRFQNLLYTLEQKFDHAISYILVLITIFIVQSVLFPLFVLWFFWKLFHRLFQSDFAQIIEK